MNDADTVEELVKVLEEHPLLGAIMYCLTERERKTLMIKLDKALTTAACL